ncbi:MAG: type IV secretion system DNA-binding domain-containing protein [Betaproteobacteria bacterium]|nr:type IV secretion system DNA-binding domain-containing protein [Betaproteobacteria bacterium]
MESWPWERCLFTLESYALSPRAETGLQVISAGGATEPAPWSKRLGILLRQLQPSDALVVRYACRCADNGGLEVQAGLGIETRRPDAVKEMGEELAICLGAMSEHYAFRPGGNVFPDERKSGWGQETWIHPVGVTCQSGTTGIGFNATQISSQIWQLPASFLASSADSPPAWPSSLETVFKGLSGLRHAVRWALRLERCRPPLRELAAGGALLGVPSEAPGTQASLVPGHLLDRLGNVSELCRITVSAQKLGQGRINASLLHLLGEEIFPGQALEIVDTPPVLPGDPRDLRAVFPLGGGLPPLLPLPETLRKLGFSRHHTNPSLRLPEQGVLLGEAILDGFPRPVRLDQMDRSRHLYVLGATGTGKSSLLFNLIRQDLEAGAGVALLDPHGDLLDQLLPVIPPERLDDVVLINPDDLYQPFSLNPLDPGAYFDPYLIHRQINDLLDIFDELYDMRQAGGPGFEQYFRNSALLASTAHPDRLPDDLPKGPPTLLTLVAVLRDKEFRDRLLIDCEYSNLGLDMTQELQAFFRSAEQTRGDHHFQNWVPYVSNKITRFTNNLRLRRVLCSIQPALDFRSILDRHRILLVRLSKGRMGEQDARMLGMLFTKRLLQAALSRENCPREARSPFNFYLDEFQNFITPDIPELLAEARKYGLHLTLAHQNTAQLSGNSGSRILETILGNVGSRIVFRVGGEDAQLMQKGFAPHFDHETLIQLPDRYALARLMVHNKPSAPFVFRTMEMNSA